MNYLFLVLCQSVRMAFSVQVEDGDTKRTGVCYLVVVLSESVAAYTWIDACSEDSGH